MSGWIPFGHRTFFLKPFHAGGETASGIYVQHHIRLPVIYGRATQVHPSCRNVRSGDWVIFNPGSPDRLTTRHGSLYCLDERLLLGVVEPGDGGTYFDPVPEKEMECASSAVG